MGIKSETSDKKGEKIEKVFFELGLKCAYFLNQEGIENRVEARDLQHQIPPQGTMNFPPPVPMNFRPPVPGYFRPPVPGYFRPPVPGYFRPPVPRCYRPRVPRYYRPPFSQGRNSRKRKMPSISENDARTKKMCYLLDRKIAKYERRLRQLDQIIGDIRH